MSIRQKRARRIRCRHTGMCRCFDIPYRSCHDNEASPLLEKTFSPRKQPISSSVNSWGITRVFPGIKTRDGLRVSGPVELVAVLLSLISKSIWIDPLGTVPTFFIVICRVALPIVPSGLNRTCTTPMYGRCSASRISRVALVFCKVAYQMSPVNTV